MLIGILAFQGDFVEHKKMLDCLNVESVYVKRPEQLQKIDGIIIPGGESFVIEKLAKNFGVFDILSKKISDGMPVYGTCAGMIMLSKNILDGNCGQSGLNVMNISVRRNAFGRQVDSYEEDLSVKNFDAPFRGIFIRAPWVEDAQDSVEILARSYSKTNLGNIVAVREKNMLATSFHPESGKDTRFHKLFLQICNEYK